MKTVLIIAGYMTLLALASALYWYATTAGES